MVPSVFSSPFEWGGRRPLFCRRGADRSDVQYRGRFLGHVDGLANAVAEARPARDSDLCNGSVHVPSISRGSLEAANGEVKTAIVSLLSGIDPDAARRRLDQSGGIVRRALSAP